MGSSNKPVVATPPRLHLHPYSKRARVGLVVLRYIGNLVLSYFLAAFIGNGGVMGLRIFYRAQ